MYGSLSLTASSPAQSFTEPLTLREVKTYLNLPDRDPQDGAEDDLLNVLISAAREVAEIKQGRDLVVKQWDLSLDNLCADQIELRDNLVSVDLFRYRDSDGGYTSLVEDTDFIVDTSKHPGIVAPTYGNTWPSFTPWPSSAVLIRFSAGMEDTDLFWSDAGARIKIGMKMLISMWFNGRLPFEADSRGVAEYPFAVTALLGYGAIQRVR